MCVYVIDRNWQWHLSSSFKKEIKNLINTTQTPAQRITNHKVTTCLKIRRTSKTSPH